MANYWLRFLALSASPDYARWLAGLTQPIDAAWDLVADANPLANRSLMPASIKTTAALPGLSPVADKPIVAAFEAEGFSTSGGVLTLRKIEQRLALAPRLAGPIADPREATQAVHPLYGVPRRGIG
jgi:hypothetical protein